MSERMVLDLPEHVTQQARRAAATSSRKVEEVLVDWLRRAAELDVEALPDAELLQLCDATLDTAAQEAMSDLLSRQREGQLTEAERPQLEHLLNDYRHGLVLKARAWRAAVARGLKPSLADHAA